MSAMPTFAAQESVLGLTVRLINMSTDKAALRGMARVNRFQFDPLHPRFVGEEILKLCERPILMLGAVIFAANRRPRADMGQIFNLYRAIRVFEAT